MANSRGIKVCGMTDLDNLKEVIDSGPSHVGFISFPPSPRHVEAEEVLRLVQAVPSSVKKVLVTVDHEETLLDTMIEQIQPDVLQLHGDESPQRCQSLRRKAEVWKVFGLADGFDFEQLLPYADKVDAFLFDTKSVKRGGTGLSFDWKMLGAYKMQTPFWLSGGIGPEDSKTISQINHPMLAGIDLNSRFETEPGIKDAEQLNTFIHEIHSHELSR